MVETPVDLEPGVWYYMKDPECVFKLLKNNTIYNHTTRSSSGHVIVLPLEGTTRRLQATTLDSAIKKSGVIELNTPPADMPQPHTD